MKTTSILYIALLVSSVSAWSQAPDATRPLFDFRKKKVDEATTANALEAAKAATKQVPDALKDKAKELLISPEGVEMRQKALQAAQTMIQGGAAGAPPATTPPPAAAAPSVAVVETPPPPVGPQPKPLQPLISTRPPRPPKARSTSPRKKTPTLMPIRIMPSLRVM